MFEKLPSRRSTRWSRLSEFIDTYCKQPRKLKFDSATIAERIGHPIPTAATEWFQYATSRGDYWTGQDFLWLHRTESADGDFVPLMIENQNCFRMGYHVADAQQPDPPIHRYVDGTSEFVLSSTTTEFALQMLILETIWRGKHRYFDCVGGLGDDVLSAVLHKYRQSAIADLKLWTVPTRFLCGKDVIIRLDFSEENLSHAFIGFATNSKTAFNETRDALSSLGYEFQS